PVETTLSSRHPQLGRGSVRAANQSPSHISPAMHQPSMLRHLLLLLLAIVCVLAYPSLDDARQDVDPAYMDSWQDAPVFRGPYQKRWANQVRFGKRASWASSVRFG
ncbi:unnamed protein product, partial [Cylicocyclus nassatus]